MAVSIPIATQLTNDPSLREGRTRILRPTSEEIETPIEKKDVLHTFDIRNANRIVGYTRGGAPLTAYEAYYMEMTGVGERINYINETEKITGQSYAASARGYAQLGESVAIRDIGFYDRIDAAESQRLTIAAQKAVKDNPAAAYAAAANENLANPFKMTYYGLTGGSKAIEKKVVVPEVKNIIQRRETQTDLQFIAGTAWKSTTGDIAKTAAVGLGLGAGAGGISKLYSAATKGATIPARITMPLAAGLIGAGVGLEAVKVKSMKEAGATNVDIGAELGADLTRLYVGSKFFSAGYESIVGKPVLKIETRSKAHFDTEISETDGYLKSLDYGTGQTQGRGSIQGHDVRFKSKFWSESETYASGSQTFGSAESYNVGIRKPITQFERFTGQKQIPFRETGTATYSGYTKTFNVGTENAPDYISTYVGKSATGSKVSNIFGAEKDLFTLPKSEQVLWIDYGIKTGGEALNVRGGWGTLYDTARISKIDYLRSINYAKPAVEPIKPVLPSSKIDVSVPFSTGKSVIFGKVEAQFLSSESTSQASAAVGETTSKAIGQSITKSVSTQKTANALAVKPLALYTPATATQQKTAPAQMIKPITLTTTTTGQKPIILPIIIPVLSTGQGTETKQVIVQLTETIPETPIPPPITPITPIIPPITPALLLPPTFDVDLEKTRRKRKIKKRKGKYAPSLIGTYLNIKGKPSLKNELTGSGIRKINKRVRRNKLIQRKIKVFKMANSKAR